MIINKITLAFPKDEEKTYQAYYFRDSLKSFRIAFFFLILIFGLFGILDATIVPQYVPVFFLIRFGIVVPFLLAVFILSFSPVFERIWQWLVFASFIVGGAGIEAMLIIAPDNMTYYAGLMLIFSAGYFFVKLRFILATIAGWTVLVLFNISMLLLTDVSSVNVIAFNFFFISANLISMLASYYIEFFYRRNYFLALELDGKKAELEESNRDLESVVMKRTQELIRARDQAQESDRLKSAFLANMSHEIRTPMNGILGFADLLKEPDLTGEEQQKYIRIIEKSGERMLKIIQDIIDISKIESGEMKVSPSKINVNELLDFLYSFFKPEADSKGLNLSFKAGLPDGEAFIYADREKLYAIITNLVKNALKFCAEGSVEFGYERVDGHLEFFVRDTGQGIPINKQEDVFKRFVQADLSNRTITQGSGLGLAISKGFVEMMGGRIWLRSEPGKGAEFYFTVPVEIER